MFELINWILGAGILIGYIACWVLFFRGASAQAGAVDHPGKALLGCIIPPIGVLVGWWYILAGPTKARDTYETSNALASPTSQQIVDLIDQNSTASLIASNSGFLKNHWHPMSDKDKIQWVSERRELLIKYLSEFTDAPSFIGAIQRADKEHTRRVA